MREIIYKKWRKRILQFSYEYNPVTQFAIRIKNLRIVVDTNQTAITLSLEIIFISRANGCLKIIVLIGLA